MVQHWDINAATQIDQFASLKLAKIFIQLTNNILDFHIQANR